MKNQAGCRKLFLLLVPLIILKVSAQVTSLDYQILSIDKRVSDYPDHFDLSTPLNAFVTNKNLHIKGQQGLYRSVSSYRLRGYFPTCESPDVAVTDATRESLLQTHIMEVISYKDSVAAVITNDSGSGCIIAYMSLENGEWRCAGEDWGSDIDNSRARFLQKAPRFLNYVKMIARQQNISTDTTVFIDYLRKNKEKPKAFILKALAKHKIVIYGEVHRRKASWDLLKETICDPAFIKSTGIVFLELSSDKQDALDRFFANDKPDEEIILNIFRDVQLSGWYDRGQYEFLMTLWMCSHKLPMAKKIVSSP